ncbi:MAG TPA: carboxypeptidase-like regulatory domain-containing protein, partial [Segetibacter sp.]
MTLLKLLCPFFLIVFISSSASAQKKLAGKITSSTGVPLEGVTVKVRSSGVGTRTDKDGAFSINGNEQDQLEISSVGYVLKTLSTNGITN